MKKTHAWFILGGNSVQILAWRQAMFDLDVVCYDFPQSPGTNIGMLS
jgi:hypothetical protein